MEYASGNAGLLRASFQRSGVWEGPAPSQRSQPVARAQPASSLAAGGTWVSSSELPLLQSAHVTESPHKYFWRAYCEPDSVPGTQETAVKRQGQFWQAPPRSLLPERRAKMKPVVPQGMSALDREVGSAGRVGGEGLWPHPGEGQDTPPHGRWRLHR